MDSPQLPNSPINSYGAVKSSSSSTRVVDDVTSLTSFNPFSEEDEHDQSSYTLVSSLFTRVKNSLAAPLSNAVAAASGTPSPSPALPVQANTTPSDSEVKRINDKNAGTQNLSPASRPQNEVRPRPLKFGSAAGPSLAPPLVTPLSVDSELRDPPTYNVDFESPSTPAFYSPTGDSHEGGLFGTAIPGFPIQDQSDARSIHTTTSLRRSESVSKIIRRIRGDGGSHCSRNLTRLICLLQDFPGITGWTMKTPKNAICARVSSLRGGENITVASVVCLLVRYPFTKLTIIKARYTAHGVRQISSRVHVWDTRIPVQSRKGYVYATCAWRSCSKTTMTTTTAAQCSLTCLPPSHLDQTDTRNRSCRLFIIRF